MVEAWGRGIANIVSACRSAGMVKPQWRPEPGELRLEFVFTGVDHGTSDQNATHGTPSGDQREPGSEPESRLESKPESLMDRVLRQLVHGPLSKAELSRGLGQKAISGPLNKVIRLLLADGSIGYTIPEKPRSRLQRYRLTDKGRAVRQRCGMDGSREESP